MTASLSALKSRVAAGDRLRGVPGWLREVLNAEPFAGLSQKPELTMFGRTYASGFETDLEDWLGRWRPRPISRELPRPSISLIRE